MAAILRPKFPHRHNRDASIDSICSVCYETVASSPIESDLVAFEAKHKCDPIKLYRASQGYGAFVQEQSPDIDP